MVNKINGGGTSEWDVYNDYAGKNSTENRLATNASYTSNRLSSLATPSVVFVPDAVAANQSSTNLARSTLMEGAVVGVLGSGGSLPTGWTYSGGGTITVVATGVLGDIPYIDIRIQNPTSFLNIRPGPTTSNIGFGAAAAGDIFTFSWYQMLVAGDYASGANWQIYGISSTNQQVLSPNLSNNLLRLWTDASPVRAISPELGNGWGHRYKFTTGPVSDPTPDTVTGCGVRWGHAAGTFDYTVRFGGIQFEKGEGTPLILSGSSATAGDGKVMLQKPLLFGMNVTNNDKGTLINRNGLIEPNVYNLAIRSQELQYAPPWTLTSATVTTNSEIAPDGTLTADTLTATSGGGQIQQVITGEASTAYTVSIYLRRRTGTGTVNIRCVENVNTPVAVTSEWQRFSLTVTSTTTSIRIGVNLATSGDAVDVWGAQVEVGTLLRAYQRTSNVLGNKLRIEYTTVEPAATNLCLQSENFTTTWSPTNVTVSANVTGTTDPFGTNLADQIFETAASGLHFLAQTMSITSGTTYTGTIFFKKATGSPDWVQLAFSTTGLAGFANFNLASGTVGNVLAGCTASIENYGNGWYRCRLTQTATASGTSGGPIPVFVNNTNSVTRFLSYTGNTATSIYVFGAQLEVGSTATPYIPTTTAVVTRDAVVGTPAALIEPSGQNLAFQSQAFDVSGNWTQSNVTVTPNVTATLDPAGGNTADLLADSVTTGSTSHRIYTTPVPASAGSISVVSGTTYSTSLFVKAGTSSVLRIVLRRDNEAVIGIGDTIFNVTSGTITSGSGTIENYGNGWYRCTNIGTSNFTGGARIFINLYDTAGNQSYIGTAGTNNMYIWGAQLETGAVATTYIPTTTASATRNADVCSVSGVSGYIGQTAGTIYCEFAYFGTPTVRSGPINLWQASLRGLSINYSPVDSPLGIVFISRNDGGDTKLTIVSGELQIGTYYKIAIGYDAAGTAAGGSQASGVVAYVNGVQTAIGTFRVPDAAGLTQFRMYGANAGTDTEAFNGRIRSAAIYKTRLPNDVLAVMTNPVDYATFEEMTWAQFVAKSSTYTELPACLETRHNQIIIV